MWSKLSTLSALILAVAAQVPIQNPAVITPGANAGLCLTATGQNNGASVDIETCTGRPEQVWYFTGGAVSLFHGKMCLDVIDGINKDGTHVQIWECASGNAIQQWFYTDDHRLAWMARDHGKCLDLPGGHASNGSKVQIWTCTDNNNNQVWDTSKTVGSKDDVDTLSFFLQTFQIVGSRNL